MDIGEKRIPDVNLGAWVRRKLRWLMTWRLFLRRFYVSKIVSRSKLSLPFILVTKTRTWTWMYNFEREHSPGETRELRFELVFRDEKGDCSFSAFAKVVRDWALCKFEILSPFIYPMGKREFQFFSEKWMHQCPGVLILCYVKRKYFDTVSRRPKTQKSCRLLLVGHDLCSDVQLLVLLLLLTVQVAIVWGRLWAVISAERDAFFFGHLKRGFYSRTWSAFWLPRLVPTHVRELNAKITYANEYLKARRRPDNGGICGNFMNMEFAGSHALPISYSGFFRSPEVPLTWFFSSASERYVKPTLISEEKWVWSPYQIGVFNL